jgi:hypothetical protein
MTIQLLVSQLVEAVAKEAAARAEAQDALAYYASRRWVTDQVNAEVMDRVLNTLTGAHDQARTTRMRLQDRLDELLRANGVASVTRARETLMERAAPVTRVPVAQVWKTIRRRRSPQR